MTSFELDELTTSDLKDYLGSKEGVSTQDLTSALMSALERIARLEKEVDDLFVAVSKLERGPAPPVVEPDR